VSVGWSVRLRSIATTVWSAARRPGPPGAERPATDELGDAVVDVVVGDFRIDHVDVAVAAQFVATACDLREAEVLFLARRVAVTGEKRTFCTSAAGTVEIEQSSGERAR
jgi:hypothetical protein